jgi:hypothetical protein
VVAYSQLLDRDQKRSMRQRLPHSGPVRGQVTQDQVAMVRYASGRE